MRRLGISLLLPLLTLYAWLAPSTHAPAHACGGTFCDGQQMPVDQTGENILFVVDSGFVEAHVQIQYDGGDASKFAWIVPVSAVPEIEVGSFRLIQNALDGSVPTYGNQVNNTCFDDSDSGVTGAGFISDPDGGGVGRDPDVVAQDTVGAFEYVVLQGGTSETVLQWLSDEGYALNATAPSILDEYLAEGLLFVAFKLGHNEGIEDIHPVVIRYEGTEPCIPLRLTRIAAKEDMDIRALFLGEDRVFPTNYRHVEINRVRLDWPQQAANYKDVVSAAMNEAGGRAFMTEFAGSSGVVPRIGLEPGLLDADIFETIAPQDVVDALQEQTLMFCGNDSCEYVHDLVRPLLMRWLPVPDGVEEGEFYACLSCFEGLIDQEAWDNAGFTAEFRERILEPMEHAKVLLDTWPYLTRLYTRISPIEMLSDPMFEEVYDQGDEPNGWTAQQENGCCHNVTTLPGGREVRLVDGGWPTWNDQMPFAERIEEYNPKGPPLPMVDNGATIDALINMHNGPLHCDEGGTGATSTSGGDTTDGPGSAGDDAGAFETWSTGGSDSAGAGDANGDSSCACTTAGIRLGPWGLALLLPLFGVRRRRPR